MAKKIDSFRRAQIGAERRVKSRTKLITAACGLLSESPLAPLTISLVTDRAGLSKGAFYNHFDSLEKLQEAAADALAAEIKTTMVACRTRTTDPFLRISIGCLNFLEKARSDRAWGALAARGVWSSAFVAQDARAALAEDLTLAFAQKSRTPRVPVATDIVIGALLQGMRAAFERPLTTRDCVDFVVTILRGLGLNEIEADQIAQRACEIIKSDLLDDNRAAAD